MELQNTGGIIQWLSVIAAFLCFLLAAFWMHVQRESAAFGLRTFDTSVWQEGNFPIDSVQITAKSRIIIIQVFMCKQVQTRIQSGINYLCLRTEFQSILPDSWICRVAKKHSFCTLVFGCHTTFIGCPCNLFVLETCARDLFHKRRELLQMISAVSETLQRDNLTMRQCKNKHACMAKFGQREKKQLLAWEWGFSFVRKQWK